MVPSSADGGWTFFIIFWVTGELSTLRQLMKVPNEPGLSPGGHFPCNPTNQKRIVNNLTFVNLVLALDFMSQHVYIREGVTQTWLYIKVFTGFAGF